MGFKYCTDIYVYGSISIVLYYGPTGFCGLLNEWL